MLSFCKRTVFVSDNVFSSLLQGGHRGSGWADNREAFRDIERTPSASHYILFIFYSVQI